LLEELDDSEAAPDIEVFDFNRPHSISRNFEQQLRNLAENFAKLATIDFTNIFRVNTVLEFSDLRLLTCGDYLGKLGNPTFVANITLAPLKGQALLHLDLGLCFTMLKKLMGGLAEAEGKLREFTEIERSIFRNLVLKILANLRDASTRLVDMKPEFVSMENNPDYVRGVAAGDSLLILAFSFKLDSVGGALEVGIPMPAFEPVRSLFDPEEKPELRSRTEQHRDRQQILESIQGTYGEVVAKLSEVDSNLETVMRWSVGDLIQLPQPVDAPLMVEIQGKPMFRAEAGRVRQNRAVKLIEQLNEELTHGD
jgi:flagellar motor switch protein FliM